MWHIRTVKTKGEKMFVYGYEMEVGWIGTLKLDKVSSGRCRGNM